MMVVQATVHAGAPRGRPDSWTNNFSNSLSCGNQGSSNLALPKAGGDEIALG